MSDSVFRSIPDVTQEAPQVLNEVAEGVHGETNPIEEPLSDGTDAILETLGIDDSARDLPTEELNNLKEIESYVSEILKNKGVTATKSSVAKSLGTLKEEMGLDENADPAVVLDRIGGVIRSWKQLSFITNPKEKRSLFMKLANTNTSKEMNRIVYQEMEAKKIWQ